jgi:hypothetical protein
MKIHCICLSPQKSLFLGETMTVTGKHYLTPFLPHMGHTPEEQLQKNHAAMEMLSRWIKEEISE